MTPLDKDCAQPLPPEAQEALRLFNAGEYYRQHDLLEALWRDTPGPVRDLYQGILQVGVAYYQITRGNALGAAKMLLRSARWLERLPPVCQGVDVARLRSDSSAVLHELRRLGREGVGDFDRSLLKPVRMFDEPAG